MNDKCDTINNESSNIRPCILQPTMNLRWSKDGRLQQMWKDMYSDMWKWQDIPVEDETKTAYAVMVRKEE